MKDTRIDFDATGLPLVPFLPQIGELLERRRCLVLTAEPGAGKSTLVPLFLLGAEWLTGSIVMLEPRRLAAVAVATRMAELLGEPVGRRVGYRVRTATKAGKDTRVEVVTEALLTRRIQDDPLLTGVGVVILDEFHERSIHADLALSLAREVRRARGDLAILVMSATLDAEPIAELLGTEADGPAPILHCPGSLHAVRTENRPLLEKWEEGYADGVEHLFDETEGDILGFLPGAGEIRRIGARLAGRLAGRAAVLPLHGTLRLEEQQQVIRPQAPQGRIRRVILATSIAETSLTVPGIRTVADAGWARLSRFHPATGLDRLVTERVSVASADQRRGRAGRLGPGLCVRFWNGSERLLPRADPEILRTDLDGLALECALWGAHSPEDLQWIDSPPRAAWSQARETLRMLGLVEAAGPTDMGRRVALLGLTPRLGVLVARGVMEGKTMLAAACAAMLEERDGSGVDRDPDFRLRLEIMRTGTGGAVSWRRSVETEMARILRRAHPEPGAGYGWTMDQEHHVGAILAYAFPDRLARKEPDGSYRLVTGRAVRFPSFGRTAGARVSVASRASTGWIVVLDADPGETEGTIRLAAPVDQPEVDAAITLAAEETAEIRWEGLVPKGTLVRRVGRLILTERPCTPSAERVAASFQELLEKHGLEILPWNAHSRRLLARMRFFASARPAEGLGDLTDAGLTSSASSWLIPYVKLGGGQVMNATVLVSALQGLLGKSRGRFESEAPDSLTLPTGGHRAIDYDDGSPAVEARIQEVFGLAESPRLCGVPLIFRLLSPAHRPLQITRDLASFWDTTYAQIRGEMRGRYPKHYWPENPREAAPISGVRPKK